MPNSEFLRCVGDPSQVAGVRSLRLDGGRGDGMRIVEFWNAAGLRFTLLPDCGMDLYDLSWRGINLSYQSKNGLIAPPSVPPSAACFNDLWPGGALVTCGLDNVGEGYENAEEIFPTHGRLSLLPAENFGVQNSWNGSCLAAEGVVRQTRLYGRSLRLERRVETWFDAPFLTVKDRVTNVSPRPEPCQLLYHCNFGYPLLEEGDRVFVCPAEQTPRGEHSRDPLTIQPPQDGCPEEYFTWRPRAERGWAALINPKRQLGVYVAFSCRELPWLGEWKNMAAQDYVLAFEPANCLGLGREGERKNGTLAVLAPWESRDYSVTIGVLDGEKAWADFQKLHA